MTDEEAKQLLGIVDVLKSINNKLDKIIGKSNEDQSPLNKLLRKVTSKETSDKQYGEALVDLNKLPFALSAKQFAWIIFNTPKHYQMGEAIQNFIKRQFEKHQDITEYIDSIAEVLRKQYSNDNNADFIEKMICRLKQI